MTAISKRRNLIEEIRIGIREKSEFNSKKLESEFDRTKYKKLTKTG